MHTRNAPHGFAAKNAGIAEIVPKDTTDRTIFEGYKCVKDAKRKERAKLVQLRLDTSPTDMSPGLLEVLVYSSSCKK